MRATKFGRPLRPGGTVGVFAPSGPYENRSDVLRPIEWFEARGYQVRLTDSVWSRTDYVAGPAQDRVDDLHALIEDDEVDVIFCLWGGTGAIEMLPLIDYDLLAAKPKAIMGFSDITNLHAAMLKKSGLCTFHGPGFGSFGAPGREAFTLDSALRALSEGGTGVVPRKPKDEYLRPLAGGRVTAPIVGGNLYTYNHLIQTPFELDMNGCILLVEDVAQKSIDFDIMFWQMRHAGLLQQVAGVVVSDLEGCGKPDPDVVHDRSLEDVLEIHLADLGVPVLYGLPMGHGPHLASIPLGVQATLDADERTLTIDEPGVR
ncbi:MAG: LD-carboxypeptidase [Actinomycetes bacterium]